MGFEMKGYKVTVEIEFQDFSITGTEVVDAFCEKEAKSIVKQKVLDDIIINVIKIEGEELNCKE